MVPRAKFHQANPSIKQIMVQTATGIWFCLLPFVFCLLPFAFLPACGELPLCLRAFVPLWFKILRLACQRHGLPASGGFTCLWQVKIR
jgi:hypothetical protein